ncbi:1,4-alpha-glucan branching protein GlgB [Ketogulonicigenium vulgare]|uniref:1,4-alpha-glucan branching protein GlgB n=1 Tax=Ketogulonicigenium vulgare TaxID=92945 RepID=UPI003B59C828
MTLRAEGGGVPRDRAIALQHGREADPFAILGPHLTAHGWQIRTFMPDAAAVFLCCDDGKTPMQQHPDAAGLWTATMPVAPSYRFEAHFLDGAVYGWQDAYRYGSLFHDNWSQSSNGLRLWKCLGAHCVEVSGVKGTFFAVWAPNARRVSVVGDFNRWDGRRAPMRLQHGCGIWEIFLPDVTAEALYKFEVLGADGIMRLKADPYGQQAERAPGNASIVTMKSAFAWTDKDWMTTRGSRHTPDAPISIYEIHLGSWRGQGGYEGLCVSLLDYVEDMGFTHIELMPVHEHPFAGSWGYQPVGLYAPAARYGKPDQLRTFVNAAHSRGIGVILDWVPAHFPEDPHGLAMFDGTALYEHQDSREGRHPDWGTLIYNFGRREVKEFLTSNALYWLEEFHVDALRVDAVASMIYRDYSRPAGEWIPNIYGGNQNLEAIAFLQDLNTAVYREAPGIMMIAEESTSYPGVTRPVDQQGLGFGYKWNMGWMNDILRYMSRESIHKKYHHHEATFSTVYAGSEHYILPFSHDEVVHGKKSLLAKMPGDAKQQFANLRALYAFMWGHPGKKLLFMGQEFAQSREWNHDENLNWWEADQPQGRAMLSFLRDLNRLYRRYPALHGSDRDGFTWVDANADQDSLFVWLRHVPNDPAPVLIAINMTPVDREVQIGLPRAGNWREILNSDAAAYGGGNLGNLGRISALDMPMQGQPYGATLTVPGLSAIWLTPDKQN